MVFKEFDAISSLYNEVIRQERRLRSRSNCYDTFEERASRNYSPEMFYDAVWRIFEVIKSSFVPRSYLSYYGLTDDKKVYESVSAHANTMGEIVTAALDYVYGCEFSRSVGDKRYTVDGLSYRDIMDAVRMHDLPENLSGDTADNGNRNEAEKIQFELNYFDDYIKHCPSTDKFRGVGVTRLLRDMTYLNGPTGTLLYLADKVSALFVTLCLDFLGDPPLMARDSERASPRDRQEMEICDSNVDGKYRASEMWTIDFFEMRCIVRHDTTMFFTKLIAMATLMARGEWYHWREKDYD